jgi:hypothetical protein
MRLNCLLEHRRALASRLSVLQQLREGFGTRVSP